MIGEPDNFGPLWAAAKLNMPRRRRELHAYIDRWLPEIKVAAPGVVIDIGPGPGDFLNIAAGYGHEVLGIDAPIEENAPMGLAYQELAAEYCASFGVSVDRRGLMRFLNDLGDADFYGRCVAINSRGSIEQALEACMTGAGHHFNHRATDNNWGGGGGEPCSKWFKNLFQAAFLMLRRGGVMVISANGTKSTNQFYDECISDIAYEAGLVLVDCDRPLIHKWVKPCNETTGSKGRVAVSHPISHSELATVCV